MGINFSFNSIDSINNIIILQYIRMHGWEHPDERQFEDGRKRNRGEIMNIPYLLHKSSELMDDAFNSIERMRELSHSSEEECLKYIENLTDDVVINISFFLGTTNSKVPLTKFLKELLENRMNSVEGLQTEFVPVKDRKSKTPKIIH